MSTSFSRRQSFRLVLALALTFSLAAVNWPRPQRAAARAAGVPDKAPAKADAGTEQRVKEAYGKLGVSFEENRGQTDARVRFLSRGGATVFLSADEAAFVLSAPEALTRRDQPPERRESPRRHAVRMKFEGANPAAEVSGERELSGRVNYFRGSDPSKWQKNVKTYGAVRYRGIYDGIDLVYYGNKQGEMEYDFEVAAGADPNPISLLIEGAKSLEVDASGALVIKTPAGELRQRRPTIYQEVSGARREVEGGYVVEAGGRVRFRLGKYDRSAPLVIDPALEYSTYLGGSSNDEGRGIAVDTSGNAYVTGMTDSIDFPVANAIQGENAGGYSDAFVAKLSADGSALVYSTYLGGSDEDAGNGIAVDSSGNAHVIGHTWSTDFPTADVVNENAGYVDAFVAKLNADGSALIYSQYYGAEGGEVGIGIAVKSSGSVVIAGEVTNHVHDPVLYTDVFVSFFYPGDEPSPIIIGGEDSELFGGVAVDSAGNVYVTGTTYSKDYFPTVNPIQAENAGPSGAFVTKISGFDGNFVYSTFLGGNSYDEGHGIAVDSSGNAYVTGATSSTDFPTTNPIQAENAGSDDVFVTKLNADGSAFVYSTYLGGSSSYEGGRGITLDSSGNAYVTGGTNSTDFPVVNASQGESAGNQDAFVAKLNAAGSALVYSTYLGGSSNDEGRGITVDLFGDAYVTGVTGSSNFPTALGFQSAYGGGNSDAFVTKVNALPSIRGRVVSDRATGVVGVPWVTVKLTGSQTITKLTDAHGYYIFRGLTPGGDYTVTPTKTNLSFVPASRTFTDLNANINDANFIVPSLSVNNIAVTEGNATGVAAIFTVTLTPAATQTVTVKYQTADGTAAAGSDYTARALTTLNFSPGQTSKTVTVQAKGDVLDESNETFRLILSAPTNALIADKEGVCTINDNDPTPSLSVNDVSVTEGDADVTATFTVTLSAASGQAVKVKYTTANGTATAPADYTAGLGTLTFAPGETTKTIPVAVKGDQSDEPTETFKLLLSSPVNATIATAAGACAIADDD